MKENTTLVVNLYRHPSGFYLPELYKVRLDVNGKPAHVVRKENAENLVATETAPEQKKFLQAVHALQPSVITKKYLRNSRKPDALLQLLQDKEKSRFIKEYIDRYMDKILTYVTENAIPLTFELNRNILVSSKLLKYDPEPLIPKLFFRKTSGGLIYRLEISDKNRPWDIRRNRPVAVCNRPAWIVAAGQLRSVAYINGLMLKPFTEKEHLVIPEKMVKTYFEKFILNVSKKVDIEAEGFEVLKDNMLQRVDIEPYLNFITKEWEIALKFHYGDAVFRSHDPRKNKINIFFDGDDIRLHKTERNFQAEQHFIRLLNAKGLELTPSGNLKAGETFRHQNGHLLDWLRQHYDELKTDGFGIINPRHLNREILMQPYDLSVEPVLENDWFDVHAEIRTGRLRFPFTALKENILQGNPYYELPDGTVFFIPPEWMSRYGPLFRFGKVSGGRLRIRKNRYPLLEKAGITVPDRNTVDERAISLPVELHVRLRPYQEEGFRWLAGHYHRQTGAILADDMGLGKTLQTIALLLYVKQLKNTVPGRIYFPGDGNKPLGALVIMPASLIYNWQAELQKFAPNLRVYLHTGTKRSNNPDFLAGFDVILTTYHTALRDEELLSSMHFEIIVADESQQIKNRRSKIFQSLTQLDARQKIALTGTPIENSLSDLWAQMHFVNPGLLGDYPFFEQVFLKPIEKHGDEEKKDLLRRLIKPYILRRTKKEVEKNLPGLQIITRYCAMTEPQRQVYETEKSAMRNHLLKIFDDPAYKREFTVHALQVLSRLRQMANHPRLVMPGYEGDSGKFEVIMNELEKVLVSGSKVLVFSSFVKHLDLIKDALQAQNIPFAYLTGQLSQKERDRMVKRFENDEQLKIFLISIKAGGTGLNLTQADYVFVLDPWWNPKVEQQAIARAHRIGQDKKVIAIKFITKDTVEEKILSLQQKKEKLSQDVLDFENVIPVSKEEIFNLIE